MWAVEDHADFFHGDQAAADHFVEAGKHGFDVLLRFNDFDHDGEVLREAQDLVASWEEKP